MAKLIERIDRLERGQRESNDHLARIDGTLNTASKVFELMNNRLGNLETGVVSLEKSMVDRLDRLIEATTRERTFSVERIARLEQRLDVVEEKLDRLP